VKAGPSRKALGESLDNQVADMTSGFKEAKHKTPRTTTNTTNRTRESKDPSKEDDAATQSKKLQKDIKAFLT